MLLVTCLGEGSGEEGVWDQRFRGTAVLGSDARPEKNNLNLHSLLRLAREPDVQDRSKAQYSRTWHLS